MDRRAIRRALAALLSCLCLFTASAHAEATGAPTDAPSADAQLAAGAVVSMHNAVMRDILHSDFEFTSVSDSDPTYQLYTDPNERVFLLVSFDEATLSRAETAVLQTYDLVTFENCALLSLQAIALPFIPEEGKAEFSKWLAAQKSAVEAAYYAGEDYELDYYYGDYVACALSLYHEDGRTMLTALAHWYHALSADDISALME